MAATGLILILASLLNVAESGYLLTVPQVLLAGSEETVCLTLNGVKGNITISLMLVDRVSTVVEEYYLFPSGDSGCVKLPIPHTAHDEDRHVNLWVTGVSQGYNFSSSAPVIVRNDPTVTFIQTDKPVYKPGEMVKFRVLSVDVNLKPVLDPITELTIMDPNGVRLRLWTDVIGEDGLLSLEMELSEEPVLGSWAIEVELNGRLHSKTFKVQEYVLPKFEVIIKPPPFLRADATSVTAEICAQYMHGQKVKGVLDVEVCIKSPHLSTIDAILEPPCDKVTEKIDGCRMFSVDSKLLNLGSAEFPFWDHRVYINASVTESGTGMTQYGFSNAAKVIQEPLKLDFSKSSKSFKPGLPYKGKLRVKKPDGKPAMDEPIKVAAVDYESGVRAEDVFLSNSDGEVFFVLPGELLLQSKEVTLLAEAIRYKDSADIDDDDRHIMYQPTALIQIKAWYSRSNSFIQIFPVEEAAECGKEMSIGLAYTTYPGAYLNFHYQVISRGNIVKTGQKKQHFDLPYSPTVEDTEDEAGVLTIQEGLEPPPSWLEKGPLGPDDFFGDPLFRNPGKPQRPGNQRPGNPRTENQRPGNQRTENQPVQGSDEDILPDFLQALENLPDGDPFAGSEPVNEDFIYPDHFEPLGKVPDPTDNPYAGREPVKEDFIYPDHFEPLGKVSDPTDNPYAGREPVKEDFIYPDHFEPLGEVPDPLDNPFAGREPVKEDFIHPDHFEPLGKIPFPDFGPDPTENDEEPKHYEPLQNQGKSKQKRATDDLPGRDYTDSISKGDKVNIKNEEKTYKESTHVNHLQISIPITPEMSPEAQLVIYYVREDGETVADGISFKVKRCFENEVEFKFKKPKVRPGKKTTVRVKADPGSLCGISVVDNSLTLEGKDFQLTAEKVFHHLTKYEIGKHSPGKGADEDYCHRRMSGLDNIPIYNGPPGLGPLRKKRSPPYRSEDLPPFGHPRHSGQRVKRAPPSPFETDQRFYSPYVDSIQAFHSAGLTTLTDMDLQTRPCELKDFSQNPAFKMKFDDWIRGIPGPAGPLPVPLAAAIADNTLDVDRDFVIGESDNAEESIRSRFSETWLWDLMRIGDTGQGLLTRSIPDTITAWVGAAVCTNLRSGLGVSNQASVSTFQPFFISYDLPYSAVRGERVPILVNLFNSMKGCSEIRVNLKKHRRLSLVSGNQSQTMCVCQGEQSSVKFFIVPKGLGKVKVSIDARSVPTTGICSNNSTMSTKRIGARDRVVKRLQVEAEGTPQDYTYSRMVCPRYHKGKFKDEIKLKLPPNVVPGSARGEFTIIGDIMGPSIYGLDKLIQLPTGCGEQNMLHFVPNLFILKYLQGTGQSSPEIEKKAKDLMNKGYQRQLTYRHTDGSFSSFGKSDETGSMWLTAFVVKSFAQAEPYIYIDQRRLQQSVNWLQARQLDSGCFPQVGQVVHKEMRGGLQQNVKNQAALTAYVLIAMLEANTSREHPSVQRAVRCLEASSITDTYAVAMAAYALTLYNATSILRRSMMNKLHESGKFQQAGVLHWEREESPVPVSNRRWEEPYRQAAPIDVEITAYALLAYITADEPNNIMLSRVIVHWLTKQRNAKGGFSSTQDTVVALQALALYSSKVYKDGTNLTCSLKGSGIKRGYNITDENKFVLQSSRIRRIPNELKVRVDGTGCAIIQAGIRYNVAADNQIKPPFEIKVNVFRSKSNINDCKKRTINICSRYSGQGYTSNMAIVEVKMATGWIPLKDSIVPVTMVKRLGIKRFEIDNNFVYFYFDEMTSQKRCFEFEVYQEVQLTAPREATVKVYDYYETDQTVITTYTIKTICGTKEEIPFEVTDDLDPMVQTRVDTPFLVNSRPVPPAQHNKLDLTTDPYYIPQRRVEPVLPPFLQKLKAAKEKEKQAQKVECPVCLTERPDDFPERFCAAQHAYKTFTGRTGAYPIKLQTDFRPKQGKVPVNGFSNISLHPACQCDVIQKAGRAMVLTPKNAYNKKLLRMDSMVTVVTISKQIEKEARLLSVSCDS